MAWLPITLLALLAPLLVGGTAAGASNPTGSTPVPAVAAAAPGVPGAATAASTGSLARTRPPPPLTRVLQLNLCLSGFARCYDDVKYPKGRREAIAVIRQTTPNAVTINEGCQRDLQRIAARTGMRLTFFPIPFNGRPQLACKDPRERGGYGNAVLTQGRPTVIRDRPYGVQLGAEQRRIGCVSVRTRAYCVTHLYPRATRQGRVVNDAQCRGFAMLLGRVARDFEVVGAGDMNRAQPCTARKGILFFNDKRTDRLPSIQHVYADRRLGAGRMRGVEMRRTNHDALLVRLRR